MTLEGNAIRYFSSAAQQAAEAEVKGFYRYLAAGSRSTTTLSQALYNAIRGDRRPRPRSPRSEGGHRRRTP